MAKKALTEFDFTVDAWHWAYLVRIEYSAPALPSFLSARPRLRKLQWCGPRGRTQSGIDTTYDPTDEALSLTQGAGWSPERVYWEPRLEVAKFDRTLGSLTTHVQPASTLSFRVTLDGKGEPDLLRDLLYGRWAHHRIQAWLFDMDLRTAVLRFDGVLDRNPTNVTMTGFSFAATQGLPLEGKWPMTRIPMTSANGGWTESTTCTTSTASPAPYGGLSDSFHPGEVLSGDPGYHIPDWAKAKLVGRVYGGSTAADTGLFREIVFYGHQFDPSASNSAFLFFHVSPQYNCYVDVIWFTRADGNVNEWDSHLKVFNNTAPRFGPTGTNVRLEIGTAYFDSFYLGDSPQRCFARIYGPNTGVPSTSTSKPYPEYPSIEVLTGNGLTLVTDTDILEYVMTQDLELGPKDIVDGAFSEFDASTVGVGIPSVTHWRDLRCAVPRTIVAEAPEIRSIIGDMAWATIWDMTSKLDIVDKAIGLAPVRRKPTPGQTVVDWTIMDGDQVVVDPPSWKALDDPDGVYANQVTTTSPTFYLTPLAGSDDELIRGSEFVVLHDDPTEQLPSNWNGIKDRGHTGKFWVPVNEARAEECYAMHGEALSQPQHAVEIELGPRHYEMNLADTLQFLLEGVYTEIGQIRGLGEDWDKLRVVVKSLHIVQHESASSVPKVLSGDAKNQAADDALGKVGGSPDPPAEGVSLSVTLGPTLVKIT